MLISYLKKLVTILTFLSLITIGTLLVSDRRKISFLMLLFQERLLGLMSLPTKDKYEELKEKRKQEQERRLQQERQVRVSCCNFVLLLSGIAGT